MPNNVQNARRRHRRSGQELPTTKDSPRFALTVGRWPDQQERGLPDIPRTGPERHIGGTPPLR
jgi:hypothetical protein